MAPLSSGTRRLAGNALHRVLLDFLQEIKRPIGAYTLLQIVAQRLDRRISPPTLYRALSQLLQQRLVARVESRNSYVASHHPVMDGTHLFLLCAICDAVEEKLAPQLDEQLNHEAQASGFKITGRTIELEGACRCCAEQSELSGVHPPQADLASSRRQRRFVCG